MTPASRKSRNSTVPVPNLSSPEPARTESEAAPKKGNPLAITAYLALLALVAFAIREGSQGNPSGAIAGTLVIIASFFPGFLWAIGKAKGFPIFPIFAAPYAINYGIHFMTNDAILAATPPAELLASGIQITGFLLLATAVWYSLVSKPPSATEVQARVIHGNRAIAVLFAFLAAFSFFYVANAAGWIWEWGLGRFYSILRAFTGAFGALSTFALAYLIGKGELPKPQRILFAVILTCGLMGMSSGFLLFQAFGVWLLTIVGYILGGKRMPWVVIGVSILIFSTLHVGKYGMRHKYWSLGDPTYAAGVKPWQYPAFYGEWVAFGLSGTKDEAGEESASPDMLERSSLLQMYLMAKSLSPLYGHLNGATYAKIPELVIPRMLVENRTTPTRVNALITLHYRMLTPEESEHTSVAWGLFNEGYANFGFPGLAGLAIFLGGFAGLAGRWSMGYPVVSFRGLMAIMLMNLAAGFDSSSGTLVASMFQSTVAIVGLSVVIMQTRQISLAGATVPAREFNEVLRKPVLRRKSRITPVS